MNKFDYWRWLQHGSGNKPGYERLLLDPWTPIHMVIGLALASAINADLKTISNTVLIPLAGVFVGMSFTWAGNAQALLQSEEIEELSKFHKGGFEEYVFVYQTAILVILVTLVLWGLAGLGIFDFIIKLDAFFHAFIKFVLFTLSSFALRECWQIVLGAQWMLLTRKEILEKRRSNDKGKHNEQK